MNKDREAFEIVKQHLMAQGAVSTHYDARCAYRGAQGLMCAVGVLIPDDQYVRAMEHYMLGQVCQASKALEGISYNLLSNLQAVHDDREPETWERRLCSISKQIP